MIKQGQQFIDRVRAGLQSTMDLSGMSKWIETNTQHPKQLGVPWSFESHEYQIAIANDTHNHTIVRKCSQVGLSELTIRIILALLNIYQGYTAIYTLPTAGFARKFAKARVDPVIERSEYLKTILNKENNSSELKQLGDSLLYINGTSGQSAAISIPADILVRDEVDFSNQRILSQYFSRLGHAGMDGSGGIIRDFSTPTVHGYGISESFEDSTKARYRPKCSHCHEWVAPDPLTDIVIPGFQDELIKFEKIDLDNPRYKIDEAYVKCPKCDNPFTLQRLMDPELRQWIHEFPDREKGGYQVVPFDVALFNPPPISIRNIANYESKADWVNFEYGLPFEDSENSFVSAVVKAHSTLSLVSPHDLAAHGCVAGLDIGKVSHLIIGHPNGRYMDVIWRETIRQDENDNLVSTVNKRIKQYGIIKLVVDANPDFTTSMKLIGSHPIGKVYACYYVRSTRTAFSNVDVKDEDGIVNANRTRTFNKVVGEVNRGYYNFPYNTHNDTMMKHMSAMKRVNRQDSTGDTTQYWVSTSEDHYAHALNYLGIARDLCDHIPKNASVASPPCATKVKFGGMHADKPLEKLLR